MSKDKNNIGNSIIIIITLILVSLFWIWVGNQVRSTITPSDDILVRIIRFLFELIQIAEINLTVPLIPIGVTIIVTLGGFKIRNR
ncbi:MAG: hypothetical protein ACW981_13195 [Candidatus Hodarchaeales archaeon]|jgi:hypothetical protein